MGTDLVDEFLGTGRNYSSHGADRAQARGVTRVDTGGIAYQPRSGLSQKIVGPCTSDPMVPRCGIRCSGTPDYEVDK